MAKINIHTSDIRAYWKCRRAWDYSSPLRKNLEPDRVYAPFMLGRAVHYGLEWYYKGIPVAKSLDAFFAKEKEKLEKVGMLDEERPVFDEQVVMARELLDHYVEWTTHAKSNWSDDKFDFLKYEHQWNLPLITPTGRVSSQITLGGRFDGLVRRRDDGTLWLWETKTSRSISELADTLWNDIQATIYAWAASTIYNEPVVGVVYNIIRKKVPTYPRVLKDGTLSKAANNDTTPAAYVQAIKEQHGEIATEQWILDNYGEFLYTLGREGNPFFARVPILRTQEQLRLAMNHIYLVCVEMARPATPAFPMPSWMACRFCSFRDPCKAVSEGNEPLEKTILGEEFRIKLPYEDDDISTEEGDTR